jgi:hypothetical protein
LEHLDNAEEHIRSGEARIKDQEQRVKELTLYKHQTKSAEETLKSFEALLGSMKKHRDLAQGVEEAFRKIGLQ